MTAAAEIPAGTLWVDLGMKRGMLPGVHQEFDVSQTLKTARGGTQGSKRQIVIDMSQGRWRESSVSGSGNRIRIFDGKDLFLTEEGGTEFVRTKRRAKDEEPAPGAYHAGDADWSKAIELERRPCGLPGRDDQCVLLQAPLKPWRHVGTNTVTQMIQGSKRVVIDLKTGLLLASRTAQSIDNQRGGYQSETTYTVKSMNDAAPADASLFQLPSVELREVKELSPWNAARIRKQLAGKPAPELTVTDIQGNSAALSDLKGKVVLLDFWTTWCPPCRADSPSLEKLYRKYGAHDLAILSISVSEDRAIVEKFLKEHPRDYPTVLTTENEMPRPYQIGAFPTYIVIDRDGTVASAVEGDRGFSDLQKLLKKAGIESE
jgi:thiol-disulfide isomerase/thioredoxin